MNNIYIKKTIASILTGVFALTLFVPLLLTGIESNAQENNSKKSAFSKKDPIIYDFNYNMTQYDYNIYFPDYTQGFNGFSGASFKIADDCLNLNVTGENVLMKSETDMSLTASLYPGIKMFLKNSSQADFIKVYFTTNTDFTFNEQKCVTIQANPNDDIFREYVFKMSDNFKWQGTINQIQVVFLNAGSQGSINIDRIGFYPNAAYSDINFDFSKGYMGFHGFLGCQGAFSSVLTINTTSNKSEFLSANKLNFLASDLSYLKINLQNNSNANVLKVYFVSNLSNEFSENKCLSINLSKNSNEQKSYVLNLASLNDWNGRIEQLKFVLLNAQIGGKISISSIQIIGGRIAEDFIFDFANTSAVWQNTQGLFVGKDAGMKLSIASQNASVTSGTVSINADNYKFVKLNLQNNTPSSALKLQWITENDKNYDDRKTQTIILEPNSNFKDYVYAIADHSSFDGKIIGLRIIPSPYGKSGNVTIKSIVFTQFSDISFLNRNIREGALSANPGANGWTKNDSGGHIDRTDDRTGVPFEDNYSFGLNSAGNFPITVSNEGIGAVSEAYKALPKQENGIIKWAFVTGISDSNSSGTSISLRNLQTGNAVIEFKLGKGKITYGSEEIVSNLTSMTKYLFDITMNLDTKRMSLAINSNMIGQSLNFLNNEAIDAIYLKTSGENAVALGYGERIYRVGGFYEDYIGMTAENKPLNTTVLGNSVSVEYIKTPEGQFIYRGVDVSTGIDTKYLKIGKDSSIENDVNTTSNAVDSFVRFAIRDVNTKGSILLSQGTSEVIMTHTPFDRHIEHTI